MAVRDLPTHDEALKRLAPHAELVAASAGGARGWLVGGVVRDALLGRELPDLDVVVDGHVEQVARSIARVLGGSCFALSDRFGCWRVTMAGDGVGDGSVTQVDICSMRGGSLDADLALRDFTINALAVDVHDPGSVIDAGGGLADLAAGTLRLVSPRAIEDDPLRMLRAARIAHVLDLEIDDATVALVRAGSPRAVEPAGERTFAELVQLVGARESRRAVRLLDGLGLVDVLIPELAACRGVEQSRYHHLDVFEHTLAVLDNVEDLAGEPDFYLGSEPPLVIDAERATIMRFAAICHDLGKPATQRRHDDGRVSFLGHDDVGATIVDSMSARWATSGRFRDAVRLLVRTHLGLGMLLHGPVDRRARYRYLLTTQPWGQEAVLLSIADRLATAGPDDRRRWVRRHMLAARAVWGDLHHEHQNGLPAPLLDGMEIAEAAGIEPGPELGRLVAALAEEQATGDVSTVEQARAFVRRTIDMAP